MVTIFCSAVLCVLKFHDLYTNLSSSQIFRVFIQIKLVIFKYVQ